MALQCTLALRFVFFKDRAHLTCCGVIKKTLFADLRAHIITGEDFESEDSLTEDPV